MDTLAFSLVLGALCIGLVVVFLSAARTRAKVWRVVRHEAGTAIKYPWMSLTDACILATELRQPVTLQRLRPGEKP